MIETSMYRYLMNNYEEKKDAVAVSFLHKQFTYRQLKDEIDRVACFLVKQDVKKGDCVTIALPNIPSAVSVFYAVNKIGAVANMVHPLVPYNVLKRYMLQTDSKLLFAFDVLLDEFCDDLINDGFKVVVCKANDYLNRIESFFYNTFGKKKYQQIDSQDCIMFRKAQKTKKRKVKVDESFDDVAVIMHSSGTTDSSKSAALTNKNFNAVAQNIVNVLPWKDKLGTDMSSITVLPMFHAFGLGVCMHTVLSYGYNSVMVPKYSPKKIVKKMKKHNVAIIAGVPTMFAGIADDINFHGGWLKNLKFAFCGGDKLNPKVKARFEKIVSKNGGDCKLDEGYGLTEASGVFSVNTRQDEMEGSLGKPYCGVAYAFNEFFEKLPDGETGELCVSSDAVMKGYLQDGEIVRDGLFEYEGKTFVKTGDLGYVDADGFIYFKQRAKRVEKVSGVNVFPAEAEEVICSVNGVKLCSVKGVENKKKGTVLKAYIVLEKGANGSEVLKEVKEVCQTKLDKWTQPKSFEFKEFLPLTNFGKVDYSKL